MEIVFWLAIPQSLLVPTTKQFCPSAMTSWSLALDLLLSKLPLVFEEASRRLLSAFIVRYRFLASVTGRSIYLLLRITWHPTRGCFGWLFLMWRTTWFLKDAVNLHSWIVSLVHIVTIFSCTSAQYFRHKEYFLRKE